MPEPTVPPPEPEGLSTTLLRNIRALEERRRAEAKAASLQDRLAQAVTGFAGSMGFVYLHLAIVAVWVAVNRGWIPGLQPFDRTFVVLATVASVEAIFLSTFVLIVQNRAMAAADRRADLDLQINLLAEHEVTRLVKLTQSIARQLGVPEADDAELAELKRDIAPEAVLDTLDKREPPSD